MFLIFSFIVFSLRICRESRKPGKARNVDKVNSNKFKTSLGRVNNSDFIGICWQNLTFEWMGDFFILGLIFFNITMNITQTSLLESAPTSGFICPQLKMWKGCRILQFIENSAKVGKFRNIGKFCSFPRLKLFRCYKTKSSCSTSSSNATCKSPTSCEIAMYYVICYCQ